MSILNEKVTFKQLFAEGGELDYYTKEGYVIDPGVPDEKALIGLVESKATAAWSEFAKRHGIKHSMKISVSDSRGRKFLDAESEKITGKELGIYEHCMEYAQLGFFSGRQLHFVTKEGKFLFKPYVWSTLNLSYQHIGGGSNGASYNIGKDKTKMENNLFYDILEGKFYTGPEWWSKRGEKEI